MPVLAGHIVSLKTYRRDEKRESLQIQIKFKIIMSPCFFIQSKQFVMIITIDGGIYLLVYNVRVAKVL